MKIVISSGHGLKVRGASGYLDEVDEARLVVEQAATVLRGMGHEVTTFHDDISISQSENLDRIVDFHNSKTRDLDVSVHFNAYETTSKPMGSEVLYVSSTGEEYADEVVDAICAASGLINRGPKKRTDLAFLNGTEEPAILVETCFVDSKADADIYRAKFDDICSAIAQGIAGEEAAPGPGPEPPTSDDETIIAIAASSEIASYSWKDRGEAPPGYTKGFALAWAQVVRKWVAGDSAALEMAKADTRDDDTDALSWYRSNFTALGMDNSAAGIDTLRHLFVLLMGLGMRESSGEHCCGRDTSADNVTSDTAEAGLYQTSYNAHSCCGEFDDVMEEYEEGSHEGYREVFAEGVTCSADDWENYGSGVGRDFQALCKEEPAFAVESCALVLRNLRQHYGPINRKEAELRQDADDMLLDVQHYVMPEQPPEPDEDELVVRVEELEAAVEDLDRRVTALERRPQAAAAPPPKKKK
jgi:N-acetylmuramoyl-L-alanine amidase